jgi:hypothetical protein
MSNSVRQQNIAEELRNRPEQERAERQLNNENIELSNDFFNFDFDNIGNSQIQEYEDENLLVQWHALKVEVDNFFRHILTPAGIVAPVAAPAGNAVNVQNVQQGYINQLENDNELTELYERSIQLGMDKTTLIFDDTECGVFKRLHELVNVRNQVLKDFAWCQSSLKKYLWKTVQMLPKVEKGDACINYLTRSINKLISTGCFLRKYRDCNIELYCAAHHEVVHPGMIIDFRDDAQREDYLNMTCSEFVDPELELAERYLQEKIRAKEAELQGRTNQGLVNARRRQEGGRISRKRTIKNGIKSKCNYK